MASLITLIVGWLGARAAGLLGVAALDSWSAALRVGLALMFALTASAHFVGRRKADLVAMVPPGLPRPGLLVSITGVLELLGAIGLLVPMTTRIAAICLALLLIVLFPANVHAARHGVRLAGKPATPLVPRTLMQIGYVAACVAVSLWP
jgi:uncharacterized membrane protein